jgi:hypothetical protein
MQNRGTLRLGGALLGGALAVLSAAAGDGVSLVRVQRLWDARPHCAFTDLCRHHGRWWCVFREGPAHVSPDGAIRVLTSSDGREWTSAARLTHGRADLRDPKVCRAPDGRLIAAGRIHEGGVHTALLWLDPERARLRECLRLPSGGDTSYPGLVWHAHRLWVSYYSSHEEHTAIYLAEVSVPPRSSAPAP